MNSKEIKEVVLLLNTSQASKNIDNLKNKLEETRRLKEEAFNKGDDKAFKKLGQEEQKIERQLQRLTTRAQTVERAIQNLDKATPKQLKTTIGDINKMLSDGSVKRGTKEWERLVQALGEAQGQLNNIRREQEAYAHSIEKGSLTEFGQRWVGITSIISTATNAITGAFNSMNRYVTQYAEMAEHMAGVTKYTGLAKEEVEQLNQEFDRLDTRTSRAQLNDLAADAGRLGITAKKDVMEFVEAANMINVALGEDLGEDAVRNIGKLAELFGDAKTMGLKKAMLATGSTINELAQSSSANEGYIMDFTARLAGMARQAGMTQAEVMGLAAVLDQAMVNSEEGSTALSRIIQVLYREPAKLAAAVGLDVQQFTETMKRNANEGLLLFARAAEQLGGMERLAPVLGDIDLTGAGVTKTLSALANNLEKVHDTQAQATAAFALGTSVVKEYNVTNNTTQAQLEKAQGKMNDLAAQLGKRLTPLMTGMASTASVLMQSVIFLTEHWRALITAAGAIGIYTAAIYRAKIATTLLAAKTHIATGIHKAWTAVVGIGNGLVAAGARIVQGFAIVTRSTTLATRSAATAQRAWNSAVKANPLGLLLSVLATAIAYFWEYNEATGEAAETTDALANAKERASQATAGEAEKIRQLTDIVNSNATSYEEKRKALLALEKIVPGFHADLSKELQLTKDNTQAINDYLKALSDQALAKAYQEEYENLAKKIVEAERRVKGNTTDVKAVERELQKPQYQSRKEYRYHRATGSAYEVEGNTLLLEKRKELLRQQEALNDAQKDYNKLIEQRNTIDREVKANKNVLGILTGLGSGGTGEAPGKGNTPHATTPTQGKNTDPAEALKKQTRIAQLQLDIQREQGILSLSDYTEKAYNLQRTHLRTLRDLYKEGTVERLEADKELAKLERRHREELNAWSMADTERQEKEETENIRQNYLHGIISHEQYERAKTETTLRYIAKRISLQREAGNEEEANRLQATYDELSQQDQLKRQEDFWQKVETLQKEHLKKSAEEQMQTELDLAQQMHTMGLLSEEQYQQALASIRKKYAKGGEGSDTAIGGNADPISSALVNTFRIFDQLDQRIKDGQATWQDYAAAGVASLQVVTATMQSATALVQANMQAETAAINQRYDREIQRAGANTRRGKKLEEKRQRELAAVKTKYNKKQMAMEMAQAVAMTATAAINAYASASKVNFILGPIAAAAALAAGAIQIAAIKKQHEAQEQGYYSGGFTGGRDYRRKAGIVHEGEFVANHQAVANPAVLPLLQLIDHAQRTNRIASLTAEDVSQAIAAPARTAAHAEQTTQAARTIAGAATTGAGAVVKVVSEPQTEQLEVLNRLSEQLDKGVTAVVAIDGPQGFDQQWTRYNRLRGRKQS